MVALNGLRFLRFRGGAFNHIGVDRPLSQPLRGSELGGFILKDVYKLAADDLAFGFGIGDTRESIHEAVNSVHDDEF